MRRVPILPTILVALAVAAMVWLGFWQLRRLAWKEALLARYSANINAPRIPFPHHPDNQLLFRPTRADCTRPISFAIEGAGNAGFRVIAHCRAAGSSDMIQVQLGTTRAAHPDIAWPGGPVRGFVSHAPGHQSLIGQAIDPEPQQMLLVAANPPDGLAANAGPDISGVPNNHFAYAVQWFLFAAVALVIYALALRRRWRERKRG